MPTPWIFGRLGTDNAKPRHLEAYPRLDVGAALRNWRSGRTMILWRDPMQVFGFGIVDLHSPTCLSFYYSMTVYKQGASRRDQTAFDLLYKGSLESNKSAYVSCPVCRTTSRVLVFCESEWGCRVCQQLENRSALVGTEVRWSERLIALEREIAEGRPPGMRHQVYEEKLAEQHRLMERLGGRRMSANTSFKARVVSEWMRPNSELQDRADWHRRDRRS